MSLKAPYVILQHGYSVEPGARAAVKETTETRWTQKRIKIQNLAFFAPLRFAIRPRTRKYPEWLGPARPQGYSPGRTKCRTVALQKQDTIARCLPGERREVMESCLILRFY
jgi:hypothetical protein